MDPDILTKKYSILSACKKISSTHKLTLKLQQIFRSRELKGHAHFWLCPPKNHWSNFQLSWICTSTQKNSLFHLFLLEIKSILEFPDQIDNTHSWPFHPKNVQSTFNFCEFLSNRKESGYFIYFFWRYR